MLFSKFFNLKNKELLYFDVLPLMFDIKTTTLQTIKHMSDSKNKFIKTLAERIIKYANDNKTTDSIMFNVDVNLQTVKNFTNADLVLGLDSNAQYSINLEKKVVFADKNEKGVQKISLSEDQINEKYPYLYNELQSLATGKSGKYRIVQAFLKNVKEKEDQEYCYEKGKHDKRKSGSYYVFSQKSYDEVKRIVEE